MKTSLRSCSLFLALCASLPALSQEAELLAFEKDVEHAVVRTNIPFLEKAYADDFRFKHGTGLVDSKTSWLKSVKQAEGRFISREIDSVEVEIHGPIGITNGRLTVKRRSDQGEQGYILKYVRVYTLKDNHWLMIMHRSVYYKNHL